MAKFEVEWSMRGTCTVEADDGDEAEKLVTEGLTGFETYMFEEYDVEETEMLDTTEVEDY